MRQDANETIKEVHDRLKKKHKSSPFYELPVADIEAIKAGRKGIIYELADGSAKPITKTKQEMEEMTIGEARRIAHGTEINIDARIREKSADDVNYAHDLF